MPDNKQPRRDDIVPIGTKNPNLPFHSGIRAGDFIFVSGQVPKDADGNMFAGTIEEKGRWTMESIPRVLQAGDADLEDIVRMTVYPDGMLARTTIEARAAINTKIEMDTIAYKPRSK